MEERVPPAGDEGWKGVPPPPSETYVVQIPRDQVYRVPPPENAKFIESYRGTQSKNDTRLHKCCCWFLTPLLLIFVPVSAFLVIANVLYAPIPPEFSVARVHYDLKNSTFEISLRVENNNARSKVSFGGGGKSGLVFKNHAVARGRFPPSVSLEPRGRKEVDLKLGADVANVPRDLRKELMKEDGKAKSMTLKVSGVWMEVSSWVKGMKKNATIITCEFKLKVDSLKKSTKVLSQQCRTNF